MEKLHLLVVDSYPVVEEGLESFLADFPDIQIVAFAESAGEGLDHLRRTTVDTVLLDLSLPDLDGAEAIRLFREEFPEVRLVVYSGRDDEASVYRALKAGARGYVLKSSSLTELVQAIRDTHRGDFFLSSSLNPVIIQFYLDHRDRGFDEFAEYQLLTPREKQVFRLLADGLQTGEISDLLFISPKTVAKHRAAIKKKLSLKNSAEIAHYAIRIGLVTEADL